MDIIGIFIWLANARKNADSARYSDNSNRLI